MTLDFTQPEMTQFMHLAGYEIIRTNHIGSTHDYFASFQVKHPYTDTITDLETEFKAEVLRRLIAIQLT